MTFVVKSKLMHKGEESNSKEMFNRTNVVLRFRINGCIWKFMHSNLLSRVICKKILVSADLDDQELNFCLIKCHFVWSKILWSDRQYHLKRFSENSPRSRWSSKQILGRVKLIFSLAGLARSSKKVPHHPILSEFPRMFQFYFHLWSKFLRFDTCDLGDSREKRLKYSFSVCCMW